MGPMIIGTVKTYEEQYDTLYCHKCARMAFGGEYCSFCGGELGYITHTRTLECGLHNIPEDIREMFFMFTTYYKKKAVTYLTSKRAEGLHYVSNIDMSKEIEMLRGETAFINELKKIFDIEEIIWGVYAWDNSEW